MIGFVWNEWSSIGKVKSKQKTESLTQKSDYLSWHRAGLRRIRNDKSKKQQKRVETFSKKKSILRLLRKKHTSEILL